jgi:hypothetical protein
VKKKMKKEQLIMFLERKIKKKRQEKLSPAIPTSKWHSWRFLQKKEEWLVAFLERKNTKKSKKKLHLPHDHLKWQFWKVPA